MAMQNKQTVLIAAGFFSWNRSLGPLIREAFYSAKKLEKSGKGRGRERGGGGGCWKENEAA